MTIMHKMQNLKNSTMNFIFRIEMTDIVKIKLLSGTAKYPTKGSMNAAGFDLYAAQTQIIQPRCRALVLTDLALQIPLGLYGRLAPRSGLAWLRGIDISAGVVDPDFTGNVGVLMVNNGNEPFVVNIYDKICQIIFEKISTPMLEMVEDLDKTERGARGFGSSGH